MPSFLVAASLALVAWGALAFGAVYPWAWQPLIAGALVVGAAAMLVAWRRGASARGTAVLWALLAVALTASLQLVPLSVSLRQALSPASENFLLAQDLAYSVSPGPRPLSLYPAMTAVGIVLLAGFTVWLAGLARIFNLTGVTRLDAWSLALGVLLALVGIVQLALLGQDVSTGMRIYGFWRPRNLLTTPFGPFVNKNHFAGWMVMVMPLAAGYMAGLAERGLRGVRARWRDRVLWLSSRDGGRLQLVAFAFLLMGVSVVLTRSRSGLTSLLIAMLVFAIVAARRSRSTVVAIATGHARRLSRGDRALGGRQYPAAVRHDERGRRTAARYLARRRARRRRFPAHGHRAQYVWHGHVPGTRRSSATNTCTKRTTTTSNWRRKAACCSASRSW